APSRALVGCVLALGPQGGDDRRDDRGDRGHAPRRRLRAHQRHDRHHLGVADVGDGDHESLEAASRGRTPLREHATRRAFISVAVAVLAALTVGTVTWTVLVRQADRIHAERLALIPDVSARAERRAASGWAVVATLV